ncbi:MAG: MFS transporter [Candidatus Rokubacteria bacterium]|nr:MFS transporter [Candidatus Rokubacteria bacterium]
MLTRTLLACYAMSGAIHLASISLNTLLPFHVIALGGSRTQVGLLFSAATVVSMLLRPAVGGWIDRFGARRVILPGIAVLAGASLALHLPVTPEAVIAVMVGAGIGNGLVSMTASVLTVRATTAAHHGEALSFYYLASSLAIAVAPPMAFGLRGLGGMPLAFAAVTVLAVVMFALALSIPVAVTAAAAGAQPGFRPLSRHAVSVSLALVLTTIGHSSIYAFLPLYAVSRGHGAAVVWFFAVYSVWLIVWRALLGGLSDRIGRARVALPAMALTALAYFTLALSPTPASLMVAALLLGGGSAVLYPTLAALVVDRAPEGERGLALGTLSGAWDLGIVVGSALIGFVADRASFGWGFAVAGATTASGALTFFLTERRRPGKTSR